VSVKNRIESVDILRGFTIVAMILVNTPGTWSHVYAPLLHAEWHGLTPTDLVFPFFLFIVGISIYFAYKNKTKNKSTYNKIVIRSLKLISLGLFLALFLPYPPFFEEFETLRFFGVLQRIGIVFLFSSILYLNCNWKTLLTIGCLILISYGLVLGYVPFPDGTSPTFNRASNNWAMYVDSNLLGRHMWKADYDPEGLLSTVPAIATCIAGILVGKLLDGLRDIKLLWIAGFVLLLLGYILNIWIPINKALWTSSFVLVTAGWATLILGFIYYLTDVKQLRFGSLFKYIGMNAITIFFLSIFISKIFYFTKIGDTDVHTLIFNKLFVYEFLSKKLSSLLYALSVVLIYVYLGYFLYKRKIFIKV
jgi:predicted acyltransferase